MASAYYFQQFYRKQYAAAYASHAAQFTGRTALNQSATSVKIGLALGSGASRGWSHIGIIKALLREGIEPDIVCGTSVGAMIGACYLAGNLAKLEKWVLDSSRTDVLRFFNLRLTQTGFVDSDRLCRFLYENVASENLRIEDLPKRYAAIATDLQTGREVWFLEGVVELTGDPAEVVIAPHLAHIGMLEFQRAGEAIAEGENCVRNALEEIRKVTGKAW